MNRSVFCRREKRMACLLWYFVNYSRVLNMHHRAEDSARQAGLGACWGVRPPRDWYYCDDNNTYHGKVTTNMRSNMRQKPSMATIMACRKCSLPGPSVSVIMTFLRFFLPWQFVHILLLGYGLFILVSSFTFCLMVLHVSAYCIE